MKLHVVCDGRGRPLTFFLSPGQMSDTKGALALLSDLPPAKVLLADAAERALQVTIGPSTNSATGSRTSSHV